MNTDTTKNVLVKRYRDGLEVELKTDDELYLAARDIAATGLDAAMVEICLRGSGLSVPGAKYFIRRKNG